MTELTPEQRLDKLINERQNWIRIMNRISSDLEGYTDHLERFPESRSIKTKINKLNKQLKDYEKILDKVNSEIKELQDTYSLKVEVELTEAETCQAPVITSVQIICNRCGSHNVSSSFDEKSMTASYECLNCGNKKKVQR